jgi:hypothetical protein
MPVSSPRRLRCAALAALLAALASPSPGAQAQERAPEIGFDAFVFSQTDGGGDPLREESFGYYTFRLHAAYPASERVYLRANAAVALIVNGDQPELPATILNATTTSASGRFVTLTSTATADIEVDADWSFSVGAYYHHQRDLLNPGGNLAATRTLADGDASLTVDYGLRWAVDDQFSWEGVERPTVNTRTHNLFLSWTQTLSPSWLMNWGLQLTRQAGRLIDNYGFLVLYDDDVPVLLIDERLPETRHRAQLNGRVRWSPLLGFSLGLSASGYLDDWGIEHYALEPRLEFPFAALRLSTWYRFSAQSASDYATQGVVYPPAFRTADSDLAAFSMHSAGALLRIPFGRGPRGALTSLDVMALGFSRSDGLAGIGMSTGAAWTW